MTLIRCHKCFGLMRPEAEFCPTCKAPPKKGGDNAWKIVLFAVLPLGLLLFGGLMVSCDGSSKTNAKIKASNSDLLFAARVFVKDRLKDPGSAEFRSEFIGPTGLACGEVNAKNSFGGYAGFARYVSGGSKTTFLETDVPPGEFDAVWQQFCAR